MFRRLVTFFGTIGILVGGFALISVMGKMRPDIEATEPELVAPIVFFQEAKSQAVTLDVNAQGEVRPRTDINLTAQVAGQVISTSDAFVDGGAFQKGDVLIKIEDAQYRATAAAVGSRLAREEAEAALARSDYEDLGRDEDPTALTLRLPQLEQARAEYRAARLDLERTTIRAPFDGRVRTRLVGVGQYVAPGAQLGRIFSTDVAEIRLPLTDSDLAKLGVPVAFVETEENAGPPVVLSGMIAGQSYSWLGRIARTDGAIDPTTRQIFAIAVVDDPYGEAAADGAPLVMGLYVDAVIEGKPFENAIILPRSALHGRDVVYVVAANNILVRRTVNVVSAGRDTFTIAGGVSPGEKVVTSPLRGAGDGDEVQPELSSDAPVTDAPGADAFTISADDPNLDPDDDVAAATAGQFVPGDERSLGESAPAQVDRAIDNEELASVSPSPMEQPGATEVTSEIATAIAKTSGQSYRPGEAAPNDEVADDLNAQQLNTTHSEGGGDNNVANLAGDRR